MPEERFDQHLQRCTVRLKTSNSSGTGFFIASGLIFTCAHVVKTAKTQGVAVSVHWRFGTWGGEAAIVEYLEDSGLDMALLRLRAEPIPDHPCVCLDEAEPEVGDELYSFGYPRNNADGDSATFKYEGGSFRGNLPLLKLKQGQADYGLSGSPLLNQQTHKVCGIVSLSRNVGTDLGGRAISIASVAARLPSITEQNRRYHAQAQSQQQTEANPFIFGGAVPSDRFYGRQPAIIDVKNRIGAITAQSINVIGLRRNGKSSLLRYIRERPDLVFQSDQKPLIIFLDLQEKRFHNPDGITEGLRRGIQRKTGTEPWKQDENNDPYAIEDGLQVIQNKGYRLILMLDEFEAIGRRLQEFQDWGEDCRAKASIGLFTLVIASNRSLSELYGNLHLTSPFSNIFSSTVLGGLEEAAWQQLLKNGFAGKITETDSQWVYHLAGGLPYYVQMAASLLWQYGNSEVAQQAFIQQTTPRFQELWNHLNSLEQVALQFTAGCPGTAQPSHAMINSLKQHGLIHSDDQPFSHAFTKFVRGQ